jgi:TonB family protein
MSGHWDSDLHVRRRRRLGKLAPIAGGGLLLACFCGVIYAMVSALSSQAPPPKSRIQMISLVQPPPPPPPPKIEEPPPEPEVEEVDVPETETEEMAESDEAPPGEELGLDAEGVAGGDAFGLAAKQGGRGLIGGAGSRFKWYAGVLETDIQRLLSEIEDVRKGRYTVIVRLWIGPDGIVEGSELVRGTGDAELDDALARALGNGLRMSRAPPEDLPQPIKIRITSRT